VLSPTETIDGLIVTLDRLRDQVAPLDQRTAERVALAGYAGLIARLLLEAHRLAPEDRGVEDLYLRAVQLSRATDDGVVS
jgi:hypothetical protein